MIEPDPTMRSLLSVHRAEVNELESKAASLESVLASANWREKQALEKVNRLDRDNERYRDEAKKTATDRDEQVGKLKGVIESLKLELAAEREAHTEARGASEHTKAAES